MVQNIFLETSIVLAIAVTVALVVRLLRQPTLIAYLIAGIVAGPFALNIIDGQREISTAFAEFGIVLLLFVVGLSLNVDHLRTVGRTSIIVGVGQFLFTAIVGYAILLPFDLSTADRIALAVAITFSSTIIIVKLLADAGDTDTLYGRHVIGLMVVQDMIAIALLVAVNALAAPGMMGGTLVISLGLLAGKGIVILAAIIVVARTVLPVILERSARSGELLFLATVAWCFVVASLLRWAGFSLEVGAIVAGISLGSSRYHAEIASRIRPLRDFFLVLFFIILGSEMRFLGSGGALEIGGTLAAFILVGNPIILFLLFRWRGFTRRNSILAGVTAAQVSEFGFVLLLAGERLGIVSPTILPIFTLTALATIVVSSYLVTYNDELYRLLRPILDRFGRDRHAQPEPPPTTSDVWLFGCHRIGSTIAETFAARGVSFAVVDHNPAAVQALAARGIPAWFGDASDVEFLESLPLDRARIVISTIPDIDDERVLLAHLRARRVKARTIVTANDPQDVAPLYDAGADFVMTPHLLGGTWMATVLLAEPWTAATFSTLRRKQQRGTPTTVRTGKSNGSRRSGNGARVSA